MAIAQTMDLHTYIESLPSLIGHVPAASLIVSGFGANGHGTGIARLDLPKTVEDTAVYCEALTRDLEGVGRTQEWERVLIVAWCEGAGEDVARVMMPVAVSAMRQAGRSIVGEFVVASETIEGAAYGDEGNGWPLTYDRAPHLGDQMRHTRGLAGAPLPQSRDEVSEQVAHDGSQVEAVPTPLTRAEHLDLWQQVINHGVRDVSTLTGGEVAQIVHGLLDTPLRDAILGSFMFTHEPELRTTGELGRIVEGWDTAGTHIEITERLRLLAKRTPDGRTATNLLVILALRAYFAGRTALATVALERAVAIDPTHRVAHMVATMIRNGIKPPA